MLLFYDRQQQIHLKESDLWDPVGTITVIVTLLHG